MDTATKEKAKAMLDAGVDKDIIIETLNISLNDLENIDEVVVTEEHKEKAPTTPNKITAENYGYYKDFITKWDGNVRDCFKELGISCPTFYRIQRTNSFDEYCDYSKKERERYLGRKTSKRVYMTKERFDAIKLGLSTWKGSDASYGRTAGISQTTISRVKRAKDYDEYTRAKKAMNDAYVTRTAAKKRAERNDQQLTLEEAVKIIEPYAIPKEEPKKVPTQVEVLERIATQLERLADYEQMKLSKKRWFRRASK